eukprot:TRINITY_DN27043_c0_g1_i2.p1 TRINITY_DN27043_c0_g1~~TRINITY_DN27043_c0_g1_i2.p1  ORF type:complete len:180 (+),score=38.05 TRINITY_DN27043_c0_g1_i2:264-803(+)
MAEQKELYAMDLGGYWMDIGQPKDYLTGMVLHLASLRKRSASQLVDPKEKKLKWTAQGNVFVHPSAKVGAGSVIGPDVVLDENVVIGKGVRIKRSTVLAKSEVESYAYVNSSIIGWKSKIKKWARVDESILGEDVEVGQEAALKKVTVCPHKGVKEDTTEIGRAVQQECRDRSRMPSSA